jgi:hypothetical protein
VLSVFCSSSTLAFIQNSSILMALPVQMRVVPLRCMGDVEVNVPLHVGPPAVSLSVLQGSSTSVFIQNSSILMALPVHMRVVPLSFYR